MKSLESPNAGSKTDGATVIEQKSKDQDNALKLEDAAVVCLVDDDSSVRKSLGRLLESARIGVHDFADPNAFLEHLTSNRVPVAILDIWMESMTGMELLAHLCARSPATRIIFITGREDHAAEATVMQAGAFAFFLKPFDEVEFLKTVRRALEPQEK